MDDYECDGTENICIIARMKNIHNLHYITANLYLYHSKRFINLYIQ